MLLRKYYLCILIVFSSLFSYGQFTVHKMLSVGYVYQNQNFGEVGGKILFLKQDNILYRIGASALIGSVHNQLAVLPKIQADFLFNNEKHVDIYHSYYFLGGIEGTPQYIAPKIGISIFGVLDFSVGYAFSLNKSGIHGKELQGLNLNLGINIPLVAMSELIKP